MSYSDSGLVLDVLPSDYALQDSQKQRRTVQPDFLLIRSATRALHGQDWRNHLYGFLHSRVPSLNTLDSLFLCQDKPIVYGKLRELQKQLGRENFPLIDQSVISISGPNL